MDQVRQQSPRMMQQPMGMMQQPMGMMQQPMGTIQQPMMMQQPVVMQQPMGKPPLLIGSVGGHRDWDSGLFSCFDDFKSMCITVCCPECALATISTKTGDCACMPWCVPGALIAMRARIRTLGGIEGSICSDCMVISCCGYCAICQMQRELDAMGL